jgi:hypothetical protein
MPVGDPSEPPEHKEGVPALPVSESSEVSALVVAVCVLGIVLIAVALGWWSL